MINIPLYLIRNNADAAACTKYPKYSVIDMNFFGMKLSACALKVNEIVSTAKVVPGSSGAGVLGMGGDLVGIVSASDGDFGFFVPLSDIQRFLGNY